MPKSPDAFRTISEVADWLGIQAHVLRFWESKFTQVKPVKRAGGRRYYRPGDMLLLGGIKKLLHEDGLTIKGVQKILREEGMSHVADMSQPLGDATSDHIDTKTTQAAPLPVLPAEPEEKGVLLSFEPPAATGEKTKTPEPEPELEIFQEQIEKAAAVTAAGTVPETDAPAQTEEIPEPMPEQQPDPAENAGRSQTGLPLAVDEGVVDAQPLKTPTIENTTAAQLVTPDVDTPAPATAPAQETTTKSFVPPPEPVLPQIKDVLSTADTPRSAAQTSEPDHPVAAGEPEPAQQTTQADTPATMPEAAELQGTTAAAPEPARTPAPTKPRNIDLGPLPRESDFEASQAVLAHAYSMRNKRLTHAPQIQPLLTRLAILRDNMAAVRRGGNTAALSPAHKD